MALDITSILGLLLGFGAVLGGQVLEGGSLMALFQPTALMIVLGGTAGAVLLCFPQKDLMNAVQAIPVAFLGPKENPVELVEKMISLALKARKEGILALQAEAKTMSDPFLRKGLELMTDGTDPHLLRDLLETDLRFFEEDGGLSGKVWESAGGFTPTVGILGAVLGLIHVMENLSDPSKLGGGIAVAFVATVYGVGFANLVFLPLGSKIKAKKKEECIIREMLIEGILAIQAGESPSFIREKLNVFLSGKKALAEGE
jgi:chemotaxis protein MotA